MSVLAGVGVGSFAGEGIIDISIPGLESVTQINCLWGPTTGFYLELISIFTLFIITCLLIREYVHIIFPLETII